MERLRGGDEVHLFHRVVVAEGDAVLHCAADVAFQLLRCNADCGARSGGRRRMVAGK